MGRYKTYTAVDAMCRSRVNRASSRQIFSLARRALYAQRKCMVEPVIGIIKAILGFRQFSLRGLENVKGELNRVAMAWNLKRMFVLAG